VAGADDSYESAALPVLEDGGIRFERLSDLDCAKRWPQINLDGVSWGVYEPVSGFPAARRGCEAVFDAFLKSGGQYHCESNGRHHGERSNVFKADIYVFAPGPWLGRVFLCCRLSSSFDR
jgi:hypothetical protein